MKNSFLSFLCGVIIICSFFIAIGMFLEFISGNGIPYALIGIYFFLLTIFAAIFLALQAIYDLIETVSIIRKELKDWKGEDGGGIRSNQG